MIFLVHRENGTTVLCRQGALEERLTFEAEKGFVFPGLWKAMAVTLCYIMWLFRVAPGSAGN
jgi:hypothetical protein